MLYLTADSIRFSQDTYTSLEDASITVRRSDIDTGELAYSYSDEITIYDSFYDYVYNKLLTDGSNFVVNLNRKVLVNIYDDCCKGDNGGDLLIFKGKITPSGVKLCNGQCFMTLNIEEDDERVAQANCLKDKRIYDNSFDYGGGLRFQSKTHPFFYHCVELRPQFMHDLFLVLGLIINITAIMFTPLVAAIAVIKDIIDFLGALFSGEAPSFDLDVLTTYYEFIEDLNHAIAGCQYGHPAPLIRDYLQNICNVCNLTFKSSIFNDVSSPYFNAVLFSAPVHKGTKNYTTWIDDNKPLESGSTFLDILKTTFNADYRVENNTLTFERKDFFKTGVTWIDLSKGVNEDFRIIELCYEFPNTPLPAYGEFKFTLDGTDWCGNEAKSFYNDIVDWNLPFGSYPQFKGGRKYMLPVAPSRYRRDGIDRDVLSDWYDAWNTFGLGSFLVGGSQFENCLILPLELTSTYKILIWDTASPNTAAKVLKQPYSGGSGGSGNFYYNVDMWVSAPVDSELIKDGIVTSKPFVYGNLYDRFFYIDDPRLSKSTNLNYTATLIRDCDILTTLDFNKVVLLPDGYIGTIEEVTIERDKLIVKGKL